MADPRFHTTSGPIALGRIAEIAGTNLPQTADPHRLFTDVAPLGDAGPDHLSFLDNKKYVDAFTRTRAGAVLAAPAFAERAPEGCIVLVTDTPYKAYALVATAFYPDPESAGTVHPSAVIADDAVLGTDVEIGPHAVIGPGVDIGAGSIVGPNVVIDRGVVIGRNTRIGANASLSHCRIGDGVLIHPGVRIGTRGFGFAIGPEGMTKVPQLGRVIVEDAVEIGANATIDRGAGPDTVIGAGTMIDNLVQIGHNVRMGRSCVIVAQAGIAGSTTLGNGVIVAAQGGVAGHLTLGDGARIAAQGGVMRDVGVGETVGGSPAMPQRDWLKLHSLQTKWVKGKTG